MPLLAHSLVNILSSNEQDPEKSIKLTYDKNILFSRLTEFCKEIDLPENNLHLALLDEEFVSLINKENPILSALLTADYIREEYYADDKLRTIQWFIATEQILRILDQTKLVKDINTQNTGFTFQQIDKLTSNYERATHHNVKAGLLSLIHYAIYHFLPEKPKETEESEKVAEYNEKLAEYNEKSIIVGKIIPNYYSYSKVKKNCQILAYVNLKMASSGNPNKPISPLLENILKELRSQEDLKRNTILQKYNLYEFPQRDTIQIPLKSGE